MYPNLRGFIPDWLGRLCFFFGCLAIGEVLYKKKNRNISRMTSKFKGDHLIGFLDEFHNSGSRPQRFRFFEDWVASILSQKVTLKSLAFCDQPCKTPCDVQGKLRWSNFNYFYFYHAKKTFFFWGK